MASLRIIDGGLQATVQDLGRPGFGPVGVPRGGAADVLALIAGNRLAGNRDHAAGVEIAMSGFECEAEGAISLAITGATTKVECGGVARQMWERIEVGDGLRLRLSPTVGGARAYLCVRGGIDVPRVMASASTHVGAAFGGLNGRALRAGDRLQVGEDPGAHGATDTVTTEARRASDSKTLRVVAGPQSESVFAELCSREFRVSSHTSRAGLRFEGRISSASTGRMISEGVAWGAVQVPEVGEPIVLGVDHPTTGGYPVVANVIAPDLSIIGQMRPGDTVTFLPVSLEDAWRVGREWAESLR